ncbi:MAG: hypothetical protein FWG27_06720 [Treponema sp.]|jgi:hypothetical protein|nr:hypothetical protein [Treponema sp.]
MGLLSKAAADSPDLNVLIPETLKNPQSGLLRLTAKKQETVSSAMEKAVMEKLSAGYAQFGQFQGIVFESIPFSAEKFSDHLASMVSSIGSAQELAQGRCLVLFNSTQDGELIGRHLEKTAPGNLIFSFQAKNPREAFSLLKLYL